MLGDSHGPELNMLEETCSVSQRQSWSCIWAAGGMWSPKPRLFVGALVPAGLASGCRMGDCMLSFGETVICASGGKKGHFLPFFSFEDVSLQHLHPETLPWETAIQHYWVLWGQLFSVALATEESLINSRKRPEKPSHSGQMFSRLQMTGGPCSVCLGKESKHAFNGGLVRGR